MAKNKLRSSFKNVKKRRISLLRSLFYAGRNILIHLKNVLLVRIKLIRSLLIEGINVFLVRIKLIRSLFFVGRNILVHLIKVLLVRIKLIRSLLIAGINIIIHLKNLHIFKLKKFLLDRKHNKFPILIIFNLFFNFKIFLKSKIYIIFYFPKHIYHYLTVGDFKKRLSYYRNLNKVISYLQNKDISKLAIFLGYHHSNKLPLSNKTYIKSLLNCGFKVIYLHNGYLNQDVINELEKLNCQVICRLNYGHDIGACKDINLLIDHLGITMKIEWLLWCNDSNYFLGGESGAIFEKNLMKCLTKKKFDVITMWESKSIKIHCQSYFLCFNRKVINAKVYKEFWKNYVPLSFRSHVIYNGEIALSQCVLNRFNIQTIYNSESIYKNILSNENYKNFGNILKYLPDSYCSDLNLNKKYYLFNKKELQLLIDELEAHNPSHTYAFLNIVTNKSPFLKKDIIKAKSFSFESAKDFILKYFYFPNTELAIEILTDLKLSQKLNQRNF